MGALLFYLFFWHLVKVLDFTGFNDASNAQRIMGNNEVNKNAVDQVLSTVYVSVFYFQFGLNYFLFLFLQVINVDDIQDILYNLDDVVSHSVNDLYKGYLQFLTPEEGRICSNLFNSKDKEKAPYENVSKRPSLPYSTYYISSRTNGYQIGYKHA